MATDVNAEKNIDEYVRRCCSYFENEINSTQLVVDGLKANTKELQRALIETARKLRMKQEGLEFLQKKARPAHIEKLRQDFSELMKMPHVSRINADYGAVSIFTDRIFIEQPDGVKHDIGDFEIKIYLDGRSARFQNLTGPVRNLYDHPHIQEKRIDPGNLAEALPKLVADFQFAAIAKLAIKFLQSYNAQSALCKIENWPEVKE